MWPQPRAWVGDDEYALWWTDRRGKKDDMVALRQMPDFVFLAQDGTTIHLAQEWKDQPALILWLRHFG